MVTATHGWAFGTMGAEELILHTKDGGEGWRNVTPPSESWSSQVIFGEDQEAAFGAGYFMDDLRAWISTRVITGSGSYPISSVGQIVLSTKDAGETWSSTPFPDQPSSGYGSFVDFSDPLNGWFAIYDYAGAGGNYLKLYRTSNGGASWEPIIDDSFTEGSMSPIMDFADSQVGLMAFPRSYYVAQPYVKWSMDGGITWTASEDLPTPEDPSISDPAASEFLCGTNFPHAFSDQEAVVVVECRYFRDADAIHRSYLYSTEDGGISWRSASLPGSNLLLLDRSIGWVLGKEIFRTGDAGHSWTKVKTVTWEGQFSFVDERHGWAVASAGEEIALVKTENGGGTWQEIEPRLVP